MTFRITLTSRSGDGPGSSFTTQVTYLVGDSSHMSLPEGVFQAPYQFLNMAGTYLPPNPWAPVIRPPTRVMKRDPQMYDSEWWWKLYNKLVISNDNEEECIDSVLTCFRYKHVKAYTSCYSFSNAIRRLSKQTRFIDKVIEIMFHHIRLDTRFINESYTMICKHLSTVRQFIPGQTSYVLVHNSNPANTYTIGINQFSDLSFDEFESNYLMPELDNMLRSGLYIY